MSQKGKLTNNLTWTKATTDKRMQMNVSLNPAAILSENPPEKFVFDRDHVTPRMT